MADNGSRTCRGHVQWSGLGLEIRPLLGVLLRLEVMPKANVSSNVFLLCTADACIITYLIYV